MDCQLEHGGGSEPFKNRLDVLGGEYVIFQRRIAATLYENPSSVQVSIKPRTPRRAFGLPHVSHVVHDRFSNFPEGNYVVGIGEMRNAYRISCWKP
jgi:hypothetical protein